ncbi:MAG: hypothetical protein ACE5GH_03155, partial [Fidelibacterota bacterium]
MIILRKSLTLFLCWSIFVLSFPVNVSAQEKRSIAVLNLQGRGISALEAETLTEYMRSEVEETGGFRSVGAGEIKGTLESQGLEETGCQTDDCALETGSL